LFSKRYPQSVYIARSYGLTEVAEYWDQVILMNDYQKQRFADNIIQTLYNTVSGKKIAFLGWAFKKDTNDTRGICSDLCCRLSIDEQAEITVYDPKVSAERIYADLDYLNTRSSEENRALVKLSIPPMRLAMMHMQLQY
jgi:UDPglucose 6-dehydrogenase